MSPSTRAVVSLCANSSGDSFHSGLMTAKEALSLYGIFSHFILRFEVSRQCIDVDKLTRRHFAAIFIHANSPILELLEPTAFMRNMKEKDQAGKISSASSLRNGCMLFFSPPVEERFQSTDDA